MDTRSLTRPASRLPWLIAAGALAFAAWSWWPEDRGDAIATSLAVLEKRNELVVFSAELTPVVAAEDVRGYGILMSRQVAIIPARVDYRLDLSKVTRQRLAWDEAGQVLTVTLPPLKASMPNLDEARAQYLREGVWITADAQTKLTRDNTMLATQQASIQAMNPVLMGLAREAAKAAVGQNLAIPLQAAGFDNVLVTVRFDGEAPAR